MQRDCFSPSPGHTASQIDGQGKQHRRKLLRPGIRISWHILLMIIVFLLFASVFLGVVLTHHTATRPSRPTLTPAAYATAPTSSLKHDATCSGQRETSGISVASIAPMIIPTYAIPPSFAQMCLSTMFAIGERLSPQAGLPWLPDPGALLTDLWKSGVQGFIDFVKTDFIDWASSFGFMYISPAALTYKLPALQDASKWAISIMDGVVALIMVVGGYNVIMSHHLGLPAGGVMSFLSRLAVAAILANLGFFYVLPQLIELNNSMCLSIWAALGHVNAHDFTLPLGEVNWLPQPLTLGLFAAIDFLMSLFLVLVQIVRIGLLDVLIVIAPFGIMCSVLPQTQSLCRLWSTAFFCTLFVQVLQVAAIGLGSDMIAYVTHLGTTPLVILIGIATTYVASKLPHMLLSGALRSTMGSVNRDVNQAIMTVVSRAPVPGSFTANP